MTFADQLETSNAYSEGSEDVRRLQEIGELIQILQVERSDTLGFWLAPGEISLSRFTTSRLNTDNVSFLLRNMIFANNYSIFK